MSSTAARAISGYRRLFRARKQLFQGDLRALKESRSAIRAEFDKNRFVTDPAHFEGLLVMIDEAEDMMLHGIVQGKLNQKTGNYEVKIKKEHTDSGETPTMEPIIDVTAEKLSGGAPKVQVTQSRNDN